MRHHDDVAYFLLKQICNIMLILHTSFSNEYATSCLCCILQIQTNMQHHVDVAYFLFKLISNINLILCSSYLNKYATSCWCVVLLFQTNMQYNVGVAFFLFKQMIVLSIPGLCNKCTQPDKHHERCFLWWLWYCQRGCWEWG